MDKTEIYNAAVHLVPEAESIELAAAPPASYPFENDAYFWLVVRVGDEQCVLPLYDTDVESDKEAVERVWSALQDWIAESKFGWGQLRSVPE